MIRLALLCLALFAATVPALAADPKVPPAKDPGLAPVALVSTGVDYTDPAIAGRLARDGEGNIMGWDFVDNDIFPYAKDETANALARRLLSNPGVELVPVRVAPLDPKGPAGAASFVSRTPVTTVVIAYASKADWELFAKAAQHFSKLLFVVPAGDPVLSYPADLKLANVLSVALATSTARADVTLVGSWPSPASAAAAAVSLAAALTTCHAALVGTGDGAARKAAIIAILTKQRAAGGVPEVADCP